MPEETTTTEVQTPDTTATTETTEAQAPVIENPEGLISTLEKYKQFGSVKELERQAQIAKQFEAIAAAIDQEGFDINSLPGLVQTMKQQETQHAEFEERYKAQLELKEAEYQQKIATANKAVSDAQGELLDMRRAREVAPFFNANAKPEAIAEWDKYWEDLKPYIQFGEDGVTVKQILGPDGELAWNNDPKSAEVKPAGLEDLINGIIDGKYGFRLQAAMKPASAAIGGGAITPVPGMPGGAVRVPKNFDVGKLTPAQQAEVRKGNYVIV